MNTQIRQRCLAVIVASILTQLFLCTGGMQDPVAGSGSETICGMLVDTAGTVVGQASVVLCVDTAENALVARDSCTTDNSGTFRFAGVPRGGYCIRAHDRSKNLVLLRRGIIYDQTSTSLNTGTDTLRPPGGVKGRFVYGASPVERVYCYLRRSPYFEYSDTGGFLIPDVPSGGYTLRFVPPEPFSLFDTMVVIVSGNILDLGTIRLKPDPQFAPPWVDSLAVNFDTARGIARLSWSAVDVADLDGYVVFRSVNDSVFQVLPSVVSGCSTVDTVPAGWSPRGVTLRYYIQAVDSSGRLGVKPSPIAVVRTASADLVRTTMVFSRLEQPADDSVRIMVRYVNQTRIVRTVSWSLDSMRANAVVHQVNGFQGYDTLVVVFHDTLSHRIYARIADAAGDVWTDSIVVTGTGVPVVRGIWQRLSDAPCGGPVEICGVWGGRLWVVARPVPSGERIYGVYSFDTKQWRHETDLPTNRQGTACGIIGDTLFVAGGQELSGRTAGSTERFRLDSSIWMGAQVVNTPALLYCGAASVGSAIYLIAGGADGGGTLKSLNTVYRYAAGQWTSDPGGLLNADRYSFGVACLNDTVYVVGGQALSGVVSSVERKCMSRNERWHLLAPIRIPRRGLGCAAIDASVYAVGGLNNDSTVSTMEVFDVPGGDWRFGAALGVPRHELGVAVLNGRIFAIGGVDKNGNATGAVEAYAP